MEFDTSYIISYFNDKVTYIHDQIKQFDNETLFYFNMLFFSFVFIFWIQTNCGLYPEPKLYIRMEVNNDLKLEEDNRILQLQNRNLIKTNKCLQETFDIISKANNGNYNLRKNKH